MKSNTLTKTVVFTLLASFLLAAVPAFAQSTDAAAPQGPAQMRAGDAPQPSQFNKRIKEFRADLKEETQEARTDIKDARFDIKEIREEARGEFKEHREETKAALDAATTEEEKKSILEAAKVEGKEKRAEVRELTKEQKDEIRASKKFMFVKRFALIETKLSKAIEGIESRMQKMSEDGMDVSKAEEMVKAAKDEFSNFVSITGDMKVLLEEKPETDEDRAAVKEKLQPLLESAKESLRSIHGNLKEAVQVLKELQNA
jgi:chromosome segregation ATPase